MALGPLIIDVNGLTLTDEETELLMHPAVGGVIFFTKNYTDPEQFISLVEQIRTVRPELLLTVDQEGGRVQRFKKGLSLLPNMQILAETDSLANIEAAGCLMALEMRALGLDLSFAPVLDLDLGISQVIGNRAFGANPKQVAQMASAFGKGMLKARMPRTGKHFPGHGAVKEDSHESLPVDRRTWPEIETDLFPFKALIDEGIEIIMTAHIVYPAVDSFPASFSRIWLQTILREQLGFNGIIFSDDLAMGGAKGMGTYPERVEAALSAGCDFVFICHQRMAAIESMRSLEGKLEHYPHRRQTLSRTSSLVAWDTLKQDPLYQSCISSYSSVHSLS
ncbi:MAG: beta-N-acetylhexosaminidase [Gammaproteobacteria bacterium]